LSCDEYTFWTDNKLGEEGAGIISEALKSNTTLTSLNFEGEKKIEEQLRSYWIHVHNKIWLGNEIGNEGARMVSESLKTNTTLTDLNMSGDSLFNSV